MFLAGLWIGVRVLMFWIWMAFFVQQLPEDPGTKLTHRIGPERRLADT
jgi:hypothetical protein